jgi:microcystin-dependent protein
VSEVYVGQIRQGGWNFAPFGNAMCNGQLLAISQNTALFSLLGTNYGGNGTSTFGLPDLRGRVMIHQGTLQGGSTYVVGEMAGTENASVLTSNMPQHTHTATFTSTSTFSASGAQPKASQEAPQAGSFLGHGVDLSTTGALPAVYCPSGTATTIALGGLNVAGTVTVQPSGSSLPFPIVNPYNTVTAVIALQGIFPARN